MNPKSDHHGEGCGQAWAVAGNLGRIDYVERPPHWNGTDDKMIYAV